MEMNDTNKDVSRDSCLVKPVSRDSCLVKPVSRDSCLVTRKARATGHERRVTVLCLACLFFVALFVTSCGTKQRSPAALVPAPFDHTSKMNKKDRFQATRWLEAAQYLELSSDYVGAWEQCQKILAYYPGTLYAKEAEIIIKKIQDPTYNRARDFYRDNPGWFGGY